MARRWDPINDRQADLLERIADGDTLGTPEDAAHRQSAYALRNRGLITVAKHGGAFTAEITEAGRFYLRNGHHPERPDTRPGRPTAADVIPGTRRSVEKISAGQLIEELLGADGRTLRVTDPDDETRASYRRRIHAAKQHGLVPAGSILRHTGRSGGDIVIRLLDADNPDETDWNRIRLHDRKSKGRVPAQDLFALLAEFPAALNVSDAQRERAIAFLLALHAEAVQHGQQVRMARRGPHPKLGYRVGGVQRTLELAEEYDLVPRKPSRGRSFPAWSYYNEERVPSGRLRLKIGRADYGRDDSWVDDGGGTLETKIRRIVKDVQTGFAIDEKARVEAEERRAAAHAEWLQQQAAAEEERERKAAAVRREWEATLAEARPRAVDAVRERTLVTALHAWRDARDLREISHRLAEAADAAEAADEMDRARSIRAWRDGAVDLAERIDRAAGPAALAHMPYDLRPSGDDLRPFLHGWSPDGPRKEEQPKSERRTDSAWTDLAERSGRPWYPGRKPWW